MYSILQPAPPVMLTEFPGRYYVKAGFYMFFGWLAASFVLSLVVFLLLFLLVAFGVTLGSLHI